MTVIQGLIYCVWLCGSGSEKWFTFLWSLLGYTVPILHVRNVSWRSYHVSNVTQLLSGSPGPWMLQPSESRLGFSTKSTLKGSGLWFVYSGLSEKVNLSVSVALRINTCMTWVRGSGWSPTQPSTHASHTARSVDTIVAPAHPSSACPLLPQHLDCLHPLRLLALPGVHPDPVGRLQGQPGHGHTVAGSHKVFLPIVVIDRRDDTPDHLVPA